MKKILNCLLCLIPITLFFTFAYFIKDYMLLLRYVFLFLFICCGANNINKLLKTKYYQSIPILILGVFLILYVFSIFGLLKFGLISIIGFIFGWTLINLIKNIKNKTLNVTFDLSLLIFAILFWILAIGTKTASFTIWDEYTFWSVASKNMYYNDSLYISKNSIITIAYPPFPTLLQYFFCKILGYYSQGIELFTNILLGLSLMFPFCKGLTSHKKSNYIKYLCILLAIFFIPAIFVESLFYSTIYTDTLLGLMFGYVLISYFSKEENNNKDTYLVELILGLVSLSLLKQTGIIFSVLMFLIIIIFEIIIEKNVFKTLIKNYKKYILLLLAILGTYISWKVVMNIYDPLYNDGYMIHGVVGTSINTLFHDLYATMTTGNVDSNITFHTFFSDFFDKAYYINKPINLGAATVIGLISIGYLLFYNNLDKKEKVRFKYSSILVAISAIIYILLMQLCYYLMFSSGEAATHASFQRYAGSIFVGLVMFLVGKIFIYYNKQNKSANYYITITMILLIFTPITPIANSTISSGVQNKSISESFKPLLSFVEFVKSNTGKDDKIYVVHQTFSTNPKLYQFRYFMIPRKIILFDEFSENPNKRFKEILNVNEWQTFLKNNFDYVVIMDSNEYFETNYSSIFKDNKIEAWSLYKIENKKNSIELVKVN